MGGQVTLVKNFFDPLIHREIRFLPEGATVRHVVDDFKATRSPGYDLVVSINGRKLVEAEYGAEVKTGDSLVLSVVPQGGDAGKDVLRIVAMLAVVVGAYYLAPMVGGALFGVEAAALTAAQLGITTGLLTMAGGLLVNAVLPAAVPDARDSGNLSESATYAWDVRQNPMSEGGPIPVLYGTHRVTPPMVGKFVETIDGKQYLNMLFAVADHEVDSIDDVRINENDAPGFENVHWLTRLGDDDQSVIPWFNDTRTDSAVGAKLTTSYATRTTAGNTVTGILVGISAPTGLCYANDNGGISPVNVDLDIEFKKTGDADWTRLQSYNDADVVITETRWSAGHWIYYDSGAPMEWVEVAAGSTTFADHIEGDPYTDNGYWIWYSAEGQTLNPDTWRWMTAQTVKGPGTVLYDFVRITGAQMKPLRRTFVRGNLEAGEYDIRVRLHTEPPSGLRYSTDVYWEYFQESVPDDFIYPGRALLAGRALATDQLSGGIPKIDCVVVRSTVSVYDPDLAAYDDRAADNPAWAAYDALHNSEYGGGVPYSQIDYDAFEDWADECDLKGWTVNVYLDSITTLRKVLDVISLNGRAAVVQIGSQWTVIQDRAESEPVQGFLFSVGNVLRDSFAETFLSMENRCDAVEVTYFDADEDYSRQSFMVTAPDYDTTSREIKQASLLLIGCTDRDLAIKHGRFMLNSTRLLTLGVSFDADVDSLACRPGDIIKIQHDVPQWGYGGRVVSATSTTAVLDREVTMQPGTTYEIEVRHLADDVQETQEIEAVLVETTTDELTLVGTWTTTPSEHDIYSFGAQNMVTKLLRVQKISRSQDMKRKLQCVEYLSEIYDDSGAVPEFTPVSDLALTIGLSAKEVYKGGSDTLIVLTWRGIAMLWNVWQKIGDYWQAYEDITDYTEEDTGGYLAIAADSVTVSALVNTADAFVYYDFGADYFSGNFTHRFSFNVDSDSQASSFFYPYVMSNTAGETIGYHNTNNLDYIAVYVTRAVGTHVRLGFYQRSGAVLSHMSMAINMLLDTTYYVKVQRNEDATSSDSPYGRLTVSIYSDEEMTQLVISKYLKLAEQEDFRYLYAACTNGTGSYTFTGVVGDYSLNYVPLLKWRHLGTTRQPYFEIPNTEYGMEQVFSVSDTGDPNAGLTAEIIPIGKIDPPDDVGTITAIPVEDGVTFTWPKVSDFDLKGYYVKTGVHWQAAIKVPLGFIVVPTDGTEARYVCTVAGITGSSEPTWPTSGDVVDNEVTWDLDESDDWQAELVDMTEYTYELSAEEKAVQGADNLTVRAWVQAVDAFDNVSETVATGSGEGLNQKSFSVTVGSSGSGAKYTTLEEAIAALPEGGKIILKNGLTLQFSDSIELPNLNLEIEGESQGGVILKNNAGDDLFVIRDRTKKYEFRNFTVQSQNTSSFSNLIFITGTTASQNKSRVTVQRVHFDLIDGENPGPSATGDAGINAYRCDAADSFLCVQNCSFSRGAYAIRVQDFGKFQALDNDIVGSIAYGINADGCTDAQILNNIITDFGYHGIYGTAAQGDRTIIQGNNLASSNDSRLIYHYGIRSTGGSINIDSNQILVSSSRASTVYGILIGTMTIGRASLNQIIIENNSATLVHGIEGLSSMTDSTLIGNSLKISCSNTGSSNHYGISMSGVRNSIVGNVMDLVNNNAVDIGISLGASSANNQGGDNITYNVGTSVSDSGSGNSVTAKDV